VTGEGCRVNNLVIFSGKPIVGSVEFLNLMVEALGIIIGKHFKGKSH